MLQGENNRPQGENIRFGEGGKERFQRVGKKGILRVETKGFEGGKKGRVKKTLFEGEKREPKYFNLLRTGNFRQLLLPLWTFSTVAIGSIDWRCFFFGLCW